MIGVELSKVAEEMPDVLSVLLLLRGKLSNTSSSAVSRVSSIAAIFVKGVEVDILVSLIEL